LETTFQSIKCDIATAESKNMRPIPNLHISDVKYQVVALSREVQAKDLENFCV